MNANKKKFLFVVPLPPPHHGSNVMNQYVVSCPELSEKYDVKVLPLHYASSIADIGTIRLKKIMTLVGYLARTLMLLIMFRPDAVYFVPAVTGFSFYRDCLFALVFKCFRVHVVYHLHGKGIRYKLASPILFRLYRWFFSGATVIHLSPVLYEDIKDVVSYEQCRFLPNGIETQRFDKLQTAPQKIGWKPVILFLSNLIVTKGPIVLLQACRLLADKGLEFKTYYVGNPSMELSQESFTNLVERMGLQDYVEYLGPLYSGKKYEIFRKSDVVVFPTEKDAFPLVLLEAMAAGLPVVSTAEGAIPEIVDDGVTGFLVDKHNPTKLSEKIEFLILNPDQRQKMGLNARKKFEKKYAINVFNTNLAKIFDDVLKEQGVNA